MKEKQEGRGNEGVTPGAYGVREDGTSEMDEEIRRLSFAGSRTRKLSSCADGSWGSPPARVRRCQARQRSTDKVGLFFMCFFWNRRFIRQVHYPERIQILFKKPKPGGGEARRSRK